MRHVLYKQTPLQQYISLMEHREKRGDCLVDHTLRDALDHNCKGNSERHFTERNSMLCLCCSWREELGNLQDHVLDHGLARSLPLRHGSLVCLLGRRQHNRWASSVQTLRLPPYPCSNKWHSSLMSVIRWKAAWSATGKPCCLRNCKLSCD